jgi:hypothetical protein
MDLQRAPDGRERQLNVPAFRCEGRACRQRFPFGNQGGTVPGLMATPSLRSQLDVLAQQFTQQVLAAVQGAPLQELMGSLGQGGRPGQAGAISGGRAVGVRGTPASASKPTEKDGRLPRRSAEEVQMALQKIVLLVKTHKEGMRAEQIRATLGMLPKEMPRILQEGLASKKLTSKGQKRATVYFAR